MLPHKCRIKFPIAFVLVLVQLVQPQPNNVFSDTRDSIADAGYPVETHQLVTTDGYILTMFRIPGSPANRPRTGKSVALLVHGMFCSSDDWIVMRPGNSLAYLLADSGYDVWLGNNRGNSYSRQHVSLDPAWNLYWNFSWHEMGLYDAPAMIDYVLNQTGQEKLDYVGHSQGTTQFFVMASKKPEYNGKIRSMHALAPTAFLEHMRSPFVRAMVPFASQMGWITRMLGASEVLPNNEMLAIGGQIACNDISPVQEVCANVLFLIAGYDSAQLNRSLLPDILAHTPAGASVKQLLHYAQCADWFRFQEFDYGPARNRVLYESPIPRNYPLRRITAPVFLHYGDNDWLADPVDVQRLNGELGNSKGLFRVAFDEWNHLDFIYGSDARSLVYDRVYNLLKTIN